MLGSAPFAADKAVMQRFKQELVLAREVTHRNVVRLYDLGEADGIDFITMEFVEGEDLGTLLNRRGKLPAGEAADMVAQICAGLQAAHQQGIVHRDLKPGNIMRDPTGRIVVMDFGLARSLAGSDMTGMTRTGALVGTLEYMSPEQANASQIDARSDLYTVGLIFYELLTGVRPFQADSAVASLLRRSRERAEPPSVHDGSIPKAINSICGKCLEIAPDSRYQSATALITDIERWKSPETAPRRPLPWLAIAVGVAAVAIVAVALVLLMRSRPAAPVTHAPLSVLVADFSNRSGDPVFDGTVEPMLNVALEGASFINAFDRNQARRLAQKLPNGSDKLSDETARLIAVSQGISTVITGELAREGDGYSIAASAVDPISGKVLARAQVSAANKDAVLSAIPKIAVPIRKALGDTTPESVQFEEVAGGFTAANVAAVHENAIGVEAQFAGKYQEAFDAFQKAAELDPKFARAYSGMAAMAQNMGRQQDAVKYMKLAMEHVDRMTERERYRNRGQYYMSTGDWQKCVQEYSQLVTRYPVDRVGQNNLATCYTQVRNAPKALEAARKEVEIVPKGVTQRLNLAFISSFAGDFAGGEREGRAALDINPSAQQAYLNIAEGQLGEGQLDRAADSYKKLAAWGTLGASIAADGLADVAAYQGKYAEATRMLQQAAASDTAAKMPDSAARKFAEIAHLEALRGQNSAAAADLAKALSGAPSVQLRFLAALTYLEAGDPKKAEKLAADLSSELTNEPQAYGKIVSGLVALQRHDARQGIKDLSDANDLLDTWIGHFELGRAYLDADQFTAADSEFDTCTKRRGEAIELFMDNVPTYSYFPAVYYYQGRAREGMKSEGFADFYKTYVALRGAAGEDPLLADARHRLGQ
ncbi:MAG TPA: protein kinase [Terriglobales bacterium]|nr:protein kinase [Terriglobales bacterium]